METFINIINGGIEFVNTIKKECGVTHVSWENFSEKCIQNDFLSSRKKKYFTTKGYLMTNDWKFSIATFLIYSYEIENIMCPFLNY